MTQAKRDAISSAVLMLLLYILLQILAGVLL